MTEANNVTSSCPTILIIDEDVSILELYERTLNKDYQVFTCSTQHDALEMLSIHHPQLIVLEPTIQGYQGWELLQEIKDSYKIPIILCSALDDRKRGMEAGATAFLIKPVLPQTLLMVIKRASSLSASSHERTV